jgi:DNA (cytosine-5)-methyltransferase 1
MGKKDELDGHERPIRFFDLFSGVGGFRVGLEGLGWLCVGSCEIDKPARKIYEANFDTANEFFWPDATTLNTSTMPDFDVLVAGFPCQPFSVAGKQRGFEDGRGTLFFQIARILQAKRPRAFLLENVEGLVFHNKGRTLSTILDKLAVDVNEQTRLSASSDCLRYHVYWKVLNSKNFGVPQNRKRIFIVGFKDTPPLPFKFPQGEPLTKSLNDTLESAVPAKYYFSDRLVKALAGYWERRRAKENDFAVHPRDSAQTVSVAEALTATGCPTNAPRLMVSDIRGGHFIPSWDLPEIFGEVTSEERRFLDTLRRVRRHREYKSDPNKDGAPVYVAKLENANLIDCLVRKGYLVKPTTDTVEFKRSRMILTDLTELDRKAVADRKKNTKKESSSGDYERREIPQSTKRLRRLTPSECFRLQGFPDSFDLSKCSDRQLYRQAGNAVTTTVVEAIGKSIDGVLRDSVLPKRGVRGLTSPALPIVLVVGVWLIAYRLFRKRLDSRSRIEGSLEQLTT